MRKDHGIYVVVTEVVELWREEKRAGMVKEKVRGKERISVSF